MNFKQVFFYLMLNFREISLSIGLKSSTGIEPRGEYPRPLGLQNRMKKNGCLCGRKLILNAMP